jgi:hypothetical protein
MLRKILKYDLRLLSKSILPIQLSVLGISLTGCVFLFFIIGLAGMENPTAQIIGNLLIMGYYSIFQLILTVSMFATIILALYRYYKSVFTDEGYLTMVIPVDPAVTFAAKYLSLLITAVVSAAVTFVSVIISFALPMMLHFSSEVFAELKSMIDLMGMNNILLFILRGGAIALTGELLSLTAAMTAITVGSLIVKRFKLLISYLLYEGAGYLISTVIMIIVIVMAVLLWPFPELSATLITLVLVIFTAGATVGLYFLNVFLLRKKFNI